MLHTQDEIRIDTEMKHRELREVGWDWSYSTKEAHNFLCHVTELRRYYSQVRLSARARLCCFYLSKHLIHNSFPGRAYPQTRQ